jgi:hypothetical protein
VHFFALKDNMQFNLMTPSMFFYVFMQFEELGQSGGILHYLKITDVLKLFWGQNSIKSSWFESHIRWFKYISISVGSEPYWYRHSFSEMLAC